MNPGESIPLLAKDQASWIDLHLTSYFREYGSQLAAGATADLRELTLVDLLAEGLVRELFAAELGEGWPPQAAAVGVVSGYAGAVAGLVGYAAFASGARWLVDPAQVRWLVGADRWPVAVTLRNPEVVVGPDHPWVGRPGVTVDDDAAERDRRCLAALVATLEPIIDEARAMTKVGRAGLWNAVIDAMGHAVMYQDAFTPEARFAAEVRRLVDTPDQPWKARPDVRGIATDLGDVCVAQRGGCCLVYTGTWPDDPDDGHEHDEMHERFDTLFGDPPGSPGYCNDCSLRAEEDCFARLVWWRTEELKGRAGR